MMKARMTKAEREAYAKLLKETPLVVEFGCGGSTVIACLAGVPRIISVDSDKLWLETVQSAPEIAKFIDSVCLLHANIGEIREWGYPVGAVTHEQAENYHSAVWSLFGQTKPRAVVLVDGRFRIACAIRSLMSTAPGSLVCFHDYLPRQGYHVVEEILEPMDRVDDMAIFQTPEELRLEPALKLLKRHNKDSR
jgi:hypothetical protein